MPVTESLRSIYPHPEGNKPSYWGKPIHISGLGTICLEVTNIADKDDKRFRGLEFVLRNGDASLTLGMPRAPIYVSGNLKEITYQNGISPYVPQTLLARPFVVYDGSISNDGAAIMTGFPSRTLETSLFGLVNSEVEPEQKKPIALFLFLKTLQAFRSIPETGHIHGDLSEGNIIVDDSLQTVNIIDMTDDPKVDRSFRRDLIKTVSNFNQVFGYVQKGTDKKSPFTEKEREISWSIQTREQCLERIENFIDVTKTKLAELGYTVDTQDDQTKTADRLADLYKKIQILYHFKIQKNDPPIPIPNDEQVTQIIDTLDALVQNAPVVALPGNEIGSGDL